MTRSLLKRRDLLKRLGSAAFLASPVFGATLREARAASAPLRFLVIQVAGGCQFYKPGNYQEPFAVGTADSSFTSDKILTDFGPLRDDVLMLDRIGNLALKQDGGHSMQELLTGDSRGRDEDNLFIPPGTNSIDQIIAKQTGGSTRFASVQLGVMVDATIGDDPAYRRLIYSNGVAVQPVSAPATAFTRLFGGGAPSAPQPGSGPTTPDTKSKGYARKRRILDVHRDALADIKRIAGAGEMAKLDEHLSALNELEKGLPAPSTGSPGTSGTDAPAAPVACSAPMLVSGSDFQKDLANMSELAFQAINCDLTRVLTLQVLGSEDAAVDWSFLGVKRGHHEMQHNPGTEFDKVQTWLWSQVAALITRFKKASDGTGSLLDRCAILVISEQSNSAMHMGTPTLGLIAGKAGGAIRTGRALDGKNGSLNNLYISLARAFGAQVDVVGEAKFCTGALALT